MIFQPLLSEAFNRTVCLRRISEFERSAVVARIFHLEHRCVSKLAGMPKACINTWSGYLFYIADLTIVSQDCVLEDFGEATMGEKVPCGVPWF